MRDDESNGPREDDWLAEDDWLDAPTQEVPPGASRRRPGPRPRGTPSRGLIALVAGASILLLIILIAVFQGDGDDPEEAAPTVPTETTAGPDTEAGQSLQIPESGSLSEGDSGRRVRRLQRALAQLGFDVTPDGAFGPGTTAAVSGFQERAGLDADGVVGPETARAINEALAAEG